MVVADSEITGPVAREALQMLRVDRNGAGRVGPPAVLTSIIEKFSGGGPVGLETLAASLSEDSDTVMDVWEPYLLAVGFPGTYQPGPCSYPTGPRVPGPPLDGQG